MADGDSQQLPRADEVHVWYVFSDGVRDPALLQQYSTLLSADERERHERFVFARDRHQFLVTRGVTRTLLGRYLGIAPSACAFVADGYGRPSLVQRHPSGPLVFNLSHTRGLIACAIGRIPELGIDVEDVERPPVDEDLPRRFFSADEVRALEREPAATRHVRFFDYWTLKEAYLKARGLGLSLPLDQFSVQPEATPPRISFGPAIDDDPDCWRLAQFTPGPRYRLAVAVRHGGGDVVFDVREFVPSLGWRAR